MQARDQPEAAIGENAALPSLAVIAHEMRGPLGAALNGLVLLERELAVAGQISPRIQVLLDRLRRNTSLMGRMTGDLLEWGRTLLGAVSLRMETIDPASVVNDIVSSLRGSEVERLTLLIPQGAQLRCDPDRFSQILSNLIRNGLEHSAGPVEIRLESATGGWVLAVENDGELDPAVRARLFQPFTRGHVRSQGLGLGLYLVRRLTEAHGGHASVEVPRSGRVRFAAWFPDVA